MTEGYASDIDGDDAVMEEPHVTVKVDLQQMPPEQALAIAQQAGFDQFDEYDLGLLMKGKESTDIRPAEFHISYGPALTALSNIGVLDIDHEPPSDPSSVTEVDNE